LWTIDAQGNYMMQMVRAQSGRFSTNDKLNEYHGVALGSYAHYGQVSVNDTTMHVHIDHASLSNWDGNDSSTGYTLDGVQLIFAVDAPWSGANAGVRGEVVWQRRPARTFTTMSTAISCDRNLLQPIRQKSSLNEIRIDK
jgi:hypothetical protein